MRKNLFPVLLIAGCFTGTSFAQAPADAPANATGLCKDGTYYTGKNKQGACRGHKGIQTWYGASANTSPTDPASQATPPASPAPGATPSPNASSATTTPQTNTAQQATAAGVPAAPGMVWANATKKIYHCPNTRWYGKTKQGEYMTEADAKAKGFQPNRGKACAD